ncbi:MAG: T9SS type A sorting domain-containing protein, partial [Lewinella sp.]
IDSSRVDFPLKALVECPFMQTQISSNRFRPCSSASVYVKYCNNGTVVAEDASITISIDEALEFVDATINATEVGDNIYNFPIGDLGIYECGTFAFDVNIPCEGVELGDVFCIEAMTSPNILCPVPDQDWTGALLQLNYTCDRDSIYYQIENIGTNDMDGPLNYVIIEDAVLRLQGSFDLEPAETTPPIGLPLNGSSYHFFAQQEPGAPGPPWLSLTTAGCLGENVPLLNQFPQYSGDPSTTTYCLEVVGSFDPNDKKAIPAGFSETNNILPNTDLDYTIRFQNTGTDTAFRVVILDTLPEELALASIIPGPSSHPYEFKFIGEGVLSFSFHNIELPDSNANLAASQGFVSFKIAQEENLPDGTHIENSAGIYFDFNPPIITNTAFHTVRSLIQIVSGSINVAAPELAVTIIPNPMKSGALIRLEGQTIPAPLTLQLFDVNGRMVRKVDGSSSSVWLERANLTTGMYFFTLSQNGIPQASGKLVVD